MVFLKVRDCSRVEGPYLLNLLYKTRVACRFHTPGFHLYLGLTVTMVELTIRDVRGGLDDEAYRS